MTSLALLIGSIDSTSVAVALTSLQDDLGTTLVWAGWTISIYAVGLILASPVAARLGERYGARRVFVASVAAFTVVSAACALCRSIEPLIALRLLQGLAGGMLIPAATAIVSHQFGPDRDRAIAMFSSVFPIGAILGPLVGGAILNAWSWQGIFLVNVPIGVVILVASMLVISEVPRTTGSRIDLTGLALITGVLVAGMVAVSGIERLRGGWLGPLTVVGAAAVTVACGWAYVAHARRVRDATVPLRLLRGRHMGSVNLMNLLYGAAVLGCSALLPHYAQTRYGFGVLESGALLTVRAVVMIGASLAAVAVLRRLGHRPLLLAGLGAIVVGLAMTALPPVGTTPGIWLAVAAAVLGLGSGLASPAANNMGMHLMPDEAPALSALRRTFRQTGSIVAVSVTTAVMSASAHPDLANAVVFAVLAGVMVCGVILAARVPNQRGRW